MARLLFGERGYVFPGGDAHFNDIYSPFCMIDNKQIGLGIPVYDVAEMGLFQTRDEQSLGPKYHELGGRDVRRNLNALTTLS